MSALKTDVQWLSEYSKEYNCTVVNNESYLKSIFVLLSILFLCYFYSLYHPALSSTTTSDYRTAVHYCVAVKNVTLHQPYIIQVYLAAFHERGLNLIQAFQWDVAVLVLMMVSRWDAAHMFSLPVLNFSSLLDMEDCQIWARHLSKNIYAIPQVNLKCLE